MRSKWEAGGLRERSQVMKRFVECVRNCGISGWISYVTKESNESFFSLLAGSAYCLSCNM